jgi:hypothetical protein
MALNSVYRVRTRGTLRGQRVEFGVHIQQVQPEGSPADLAASWVANIIPLVDAAISVEVNLTDVMVNDTAETGSEQYILNLTQPHPGLVTGDCLPGQNAAVVSLRTGQKGRRRRGRFYVFGISETAHSNGVISGPQLTAIQALGDGIVDRYNGGALEPNYRLVIYSPPTPPFVAKPPPPAHTDTLISPVLTYQVDPIVRTQRRRMIGVGQ